MPFIRLQCSQKAYSGCRMPLTHLDAPPLLVPVPCPNSHVVTAGQDNGRGRMDGQASDVVRMCLEGRDLFVGVVIEDP